MESTVEQKLQALIKLQKLDSELDEIIKVRGDLPEEVRDLEDEIAGLETRKGKFDDDVKGLEGSISDYKTKIKESEALIKKYKDQQMNVRNNREYDAITKELELQELEIQVNEKRINEAHKNIDFKKEDIDKLAGRISERNEDLKIKKDELEVIVQESKDKEEKILKDRQKAYKAVDERLGLSYQKLRDNARNGLAVVSVKRDACGGCFNTVPPQRQADIRDRKKIIVCEHCGRILADVEQVIEEEKPKRKATRKKKESA